jgi:hypothetical protein
MTPQGPSLRLELTIVRPFEEEDEKEAGTGREATSLRDGKAARYPESSGGAAAATSAVRDDLRWARGKA